MKLDLADIFGILGLISLAGGVGFEFGATWSAIITGAVLLFIGYRNA